jgi:hypothetical protein
VWRGSSTDCDGLADHLQRRPGGRGNGRLIAPFALKQTAKEIPGRLKGYKSVLESESD